MGSRTRRNHRSDDRNDDVRRTGGRLLLPGHELDRVPAVPIGAAKGARVPGRPIPKNPSRRTQMSTELRTSTLDTADAQTGMSAIARRIQTSVYNFYKEEDGLS